MTAPTRRSGPAAPDWTDASGSDPGLTVLQVFAFLALAVLFALALQRWRTSRSVR